jgi:hypothetical protein
MLPPSWIRRLGPSLWTDRQKRRVLVTFAVSVLLLCQLSVHVLILRSMPNQHQASLLREQHEVISVMSMMRAPRKGPNGQLREQQGKETGIKNVGDEPDHMHPIAESPPALRTYPHTKDDDDVREARILTIMTKTGYSREKVEELFHEAMFSSSGQKLTPIGGAQSEWLRQQRQQKLIAQHRNVSDPNSKNRNNGLCYHHGGCTCDDLFGRRQLIPALGGTCLMHQLVHWTSCRLGDIALNPSRIVGSWGGETNLNAIWGRSEQMEALQYQEGALVLLQPDLAPIVHSPALANLSFDDRVNELFQSAVSTKENQHRSKEAVPASMGVQRQQKQSTTLLVRRGAYANPCMALLTMYNVYLTLHHFNVQEHDPKTIVWLDGHARGDLDGVWETLFGTKPIHVKKLTVSDGNGNVTGDADASAIPMGTAIIVNTKSHAGNEGMDIYRWRRTDSNTPNCTLDHTNTLVAFRDFVLLRFGMERRRLGHAGMARDGSARPRLTFLVRKDYVAHPRSTGHTDRALANPQDDLTYLQGLYVNHTISVVSFEGMDFRRQLEHITQTDTFVAVHGAGNIHTLFLPDHATFVEYFPSEFKRRRRFRFLAECLNITYHQKIAWAVKGMDEKSKVLVRLRPKSPLDLTSWCDNDQKIDPC